MSYPQYARRPFFPSRSQSLVSAATTPSSPRMSWLPSAMEHSSRGDSISATGPAVPTVYPPPLAAQGALKSVSGVDEIMLLDVPINRADAQDARPPGAQRLRLRKR